MWKIGSRDAITGLRDGVDSQVPRIYNQWSDEDEDASLRADMVNVGLE